MAGNVPYDLNQDGWIGAYEMAFYEQDQEKAAYWRSHFIDGLNDQLVEACEAAEKILTSFAEITGCSEKLLPTKMIYHYLMQGIIKKNLWNYIVREPSFVFLDQHEFYPARLLLNNFYRYFPAPCGLATIENSLSEGKLLYQEEATLTNTLCGAGWNIFVDSLVNKDEDSAETIIVDFTNEIAQLCFSFVAELHFDEQFTFALELSDILSELWEKRQEED